MITLTDQNFEKEITNAEKPVLVDFWAFYCIPCFILTPVLEKLAKEYEDKIILAKANLDTIPIAAQKYGVDRIPMVILFNRGKAVSGFVGVRPEPVIREWLEKMLKENKDEKIDPFGKLRVNAEQSRSIEKLIKELEDYAKKNGFRLNPDRQILEMLIKGLIENEKKYSGRYCPCRRITGNPEEDRKIICPCESCPKEVKENGYCLCRLFVR